jgi:hypothetical protein
MVQVKRFFHKDFSRKIVMTILSTHPGSMPHKGFGFWTVIQKNATLLFDF